MPFKRPVGSSDDDWEASAPSPLEAGGDFFVKRHTFRFAFVASLVGFLFFFVVGSVIDLRSAGRSATLEDIWALVVEPGGTAGDSLLYIVQVVAAILGVALTVVAIVVQLAANRYTPKIIDLFVRDPVNVPTLALFVVTVLEGMWVAHTRTPDFAPRLGILVTLGLSSASMLVLLPYFRHVFRFLEPENVVHRIRDEVVDDVRRAAAAGTEGACAHGQTHVLHSLDHLFDIARNAINNSDRTLATETIFALRDALVMAYRQKAALPPAWFRIYERAKTNADFLNFPAAALVEFERERTWLERKIYWQLNLLFQGAVGRMRGVCSTIAMVVVELGALELERGELPTKKLAIRTFNTLLRSGLNGQDVRTLYNLFQHYRLFGERALARGDLPLVRELFQHFRYYGRTGDALGMGFVLETATYDMGILLREALSRGLAAADVDHFLETILSCGVDPEGVPLRPATRHGVRRAHAVLGVHLLAKGHEALARRVVREIAQEPASRLAAIRDEILAAESQFFELTERVASFGYVPDAERARVASFFAWTAQPEGPPPDVAPSSTDGAIDTQRASEAAR